MPDVIKRLRQRLSRHPRGWGRGSAKMVRDREKLGWRLAGAIETFKEKGVPRLAERQAPYLLAGEPRLITGCRSSWPGASSRPGSSG